MSGDETVPSAEAANQALNLVVTGRRSRVNVTTAQASPLRRAVGESPVLDRTFCGPDGPLRAMRGSDSARLLGGAVAGVADGYALGAAALGGRAGQPTHVARGRPESKSWERL
jgi:hypothetical protein